MSKLSTALKAAARAGYAICVIDTAPATDSDVRSCIAAADLVLMPVRATQDDLDAVGETLKVVKAEGRAGAFVLNAAQKGTAAALRALATNHYAVLPSFRLSFLNAFRQGANHCGKLKV